MVAVVANLVRTPLGMLRTWGAGLAGLGRLGAGAIAARRTEAGVGGFLAAAAGDPVRQRQGLDVLRAFAPNLSLRRVLVKSYDNTGTAIVTRREDVLDVLHRDADFEVVYGPRMRKLTGGGNFFLGMQPGWDYTRDVSAMRLAARMSDVDRLIRPRAAALAADLVAQSGGRLDLPPDLTLQVPWDMTERYFGAGGPDAATMQDWTTTMFWYLFGDLDADPGLESRTMAHAGAMRGWLDSRIAERKADPSDAADILNRCLALQAAGTPGMDDPGIRNNLLGLLIGAIPTISKACCLALDELFRQPEGLRWAQAAARDGDDDRLARCIWEALRFNPHNPVIYRRATRDATVAAGTLRQMRVRKGQMVFAATLSAMFDRSAIEAPETFRIDRRFENYIIWGTGLHTCFGAAINAVVIPAILKPVLAQHNLRRVDGATGRIDTGGTPFPQHFAVTFDPA